MPHPLFELKRTDAPLVFACAEGVAQRVRSKLLCDAYPLAVLGDDVLHAAGADGVAKAVQEHAVGRRNRSMLVDVGLECLGRLARQRNNPL